MRCCHGSAYYNDICLSLGIDEQYQASVVCVLLVHSRERDEVLYHLGHVLSCSTCFQGSVIYHHLTRCWCVCDMQKVQQYGITLFYLHSYIRLMMWYMYCMWWFHKDLASFVSPSMSFVPFGWSQVSTLQFAEDLGQVPMHFLCLWCRLCNMYHESYMFPLKMLKIIFKRNIWWTCILLAYQVISSQPFLVGQHLEAYWNHWVPSWWSMIFKRPLSYRTC